MPSLADLLEGKSVALVGNSSRILRDRPGKLIDRADVVIRMNRGLPQVTDPNAIGKRTTVWATAKFWPDLRIPEDCELVIWMKLTKLGKQQREHMSAMCQRQICPMLLWPQEREDECREFVGADPGTGIRLLWWLKHHARARAVSVYGMDCWEVPSHWSGKMNTPNHYPQLERDAMLRLL